MIPLGFMRSLFCYAGMLAGCLLLAASGDAADDKKDDKKPEKTPAKEEKAVKAAPGAAPVQVQGKVAARRRLNAKAAAVAAQQNAAAPVQVLVAPAVQVRGAMQLKLVQPPQNPGPAGDNEYSEGITLSTDRNIKKILEAAQELLEEAAKNDSWGEAAGLLQQVLDVKEDVFIPVKRRSADGVEKTHQVSARAEANRLLEAMPAKGREFYELRFGAQAKGAAWKRSQEATVATRD